MRYSTVLWGMLLSSLLIAGCDTTGPVDFEPEYVVQSYQEAGRRLGVVRLSQTAPVDSVYDFTEVAVSEASVQVQLLGQEGQVEDSYSYRERAWQPGVYEPEDVATVKPLRTYRLRAAVPQPGGGEHVITSTTVVPDTFRLVEATADTIVYKSNEQLSLRVTRSQYPDRQSIYLFSSEALGELSRGRLTPSRRRLIEENADLEVIRTTTSPPLNEANYQVGAGNTIMIRLPWLTLSFYGLHQLSASAIDNNYYDFIRTETAQQGGSTLAPGEIPNVIDHVEGGTGLFGSYAQVEYQVFVER